MTDGANPTATLVVVQQDPRKNDYHLIHEILNIRLNLLRYFLDRLDDIVAPNYRPSNMDILYARVETRSAYHSVFHPSKQSKDLSMVLIDVGGQRELR